MQGSLECASCGRDVSDLHDARTAGLRVYCTRRCYLLHAHTRPVPSWGKEHADAWADPWVDLSTLDFTELVGVVLNLCLLDFARARRDVELARLRMTDEGHLNDARDRLAGALQLTERIREAPAYFEATPAVIESYRAERNSGLTEGRFGLDLFRIPSDPLVRPFVVAVCVAILGMQPTDAAKLISDVDHHGAQIVLEHVSHQDAENLKEALERFGFSVSIIETSAPAVIAEAPATRAIAADVRREASRQEP
jgi:hypothetical protein